MTTTVLAYIPSPSQGVWHLGVVPIRAYALFIVAGMLAALFVGDRRWEARGGERGVIYSIFWWAMPFGLIGGRLYHVITDWQTYFGDGGAGLAAAFQIWEGGLGIWGAVALGGVGAWIGCRRHGIPLPAFGDAIAPGIILAQAIGRLGNYFNQELYGGPTTLPWGLEIYERRDASGFIDSLNGASTGQLVEVVHPTFLYELLWNLLVFAALIYIDRRFKIGHGRLFAMYVAGYCLGRFWIELIRVDEATDFAGIRVNSFTSTFAFIGAVVYIMVAPKGREDPATLKGKPREAEEKEEDTSVEEFVKELTGVAAATTGVVAAAKVAGEAEDEDAKAAADGETQEEAEESAPESEAAAEAEQLAEDVEEAPSEDIAEAEEFAEAKEEAEAEALGADVAGVPADDLAEAEEFAAEGEEEPESEAAAEAEALAEDVAEAPSEDIAEAEEFAAAKEAAEEAEPVGGVGAVEGEEAVEAEAAAPDAHEAAVDAAEEAEGVAAEVTDTSADDEPEPDAEIEEPSEASAEPDGPVDDEAETGEVAAEPEDLETEDETEEPETEDAEAAVDDADAEPSDEEAAEEAEAVIDEAEAAEEEPEAEVLESEPEPEAAAIDEEPEPDEAERSGGRLRRWFRGRRTR